jgi:hypothetical protein
LNQEWSTFDLELVFGDVADHDIVPPLDLAAYGLLMPTGIPCMTIIEQVAQKLHAVTDPNENRPRDLIDIYLCIVRLPPNENDLRETCATMFLQRDIQAWPPELLMREEWPAQLSEIIAQSELDINADGVFEGVRGLIARLASSD